ncbi:unnamed protein product [Protopolystoma xenopodis]|uniref:BED-type domain-containing protein n=1 Tax=Protopolystoma xenopodis TaxID=117903 RepID=A0A448XKD8_9PLAT|nr:unnamed protein product [Protopolystoma xenopodis]
MGPGWSVGATSASTGLELWCARLGCCCFSYFQTTSSDALSLKRHMKRRCCRISPLKSPAPSPHLSSTSSSLYSKSIQLRLS